MPGLPSPKPTVHIIHPTGLGTSPHGPLGYYSQIAWLHAIAIGCKAALLGRAHRGAGGEGGDEVGGERIDWAMELSEGEQVDLDALYLFGKSYERKGMKEEAKEAFQKAFDVEPD